MSDTNVITALTAVMNDVQAVKKGDRNASQGFNFRGIDAVMNAVGPALRKHGVVVVPCVVNYDYGSVEVGKNRTPMGHVRLTVDYTFYGPGGDSITATSVGEAMDSGDKATAKAMSVAFRTALLQALCLPTDEPDPDHDTYERSEAPAPAPQRTAMTEVDEEKVTGAMQTASTAEALEKFKELAIAKFTMTEEQVDRVREAYEVRKHELSEPAALVGP